MKVIEDKVFFPWGVKLYPSGEFVLWRKQRERKQQQQESLVSAGFWLFAGRDLGEVFRLYGAPTVYRWWRASEALVMQGMRPKASGAVISAGGNNEGDGSGLVGLSAPSNLQKKRRGLGGLTSKGKVTVREAAYALQEKYGKWNLTFWTCTLPQLSSEDCVSVCTNWASVMKNLREKVKYHLELAGLPTNIVGVTELQPERWRRTLFPGWHIHWLFVGRKSTGDWALDTELGDKLWREAIEEHCSGKYDFSGSCRLEPIRKSAGGYMAKYMSKGSSSALEVESAFPGCVPSSWYVCTRALSQWVKKSTRQSEEVARYLYQRLLDDLGSVIAPWAFKLETRPGTSIAVVWLGRLPDPPAPVHPVP